MIEFLRDIIVQVLSGAITIYVLPFVVYILTLLFRRQGNATADQQPNVRRRPSEVEGFDSKIGQDQIGGFAVTVAAIPLLSIPLVIYNLIVMTGVPGELYAVDAWLSAPIFTVALFSGDHFDVAFSDLFMLTALLAMLLETIRYNRGHSLGFVRQSLGVLVCVTAVLQFVVLLGFSTTSFFWLVLMTFLGVVAGFSRQDADSLSTARVRGGWFLNAAPLLIFPFLVFNAILLAGFSGSPDQFPYWQMAPMFTISMFSGDHWDVSFADLFLLMAGVLCFVELTKKLRSQVVATINVVLSILLCVLCIVEFLAVRGFANTTFFLLLLMTILNVIGDLAMTRVSHGHEAAYAT